MDRLRRLLNPEQPYEPLPSPPPDPEDADSSALHDSHPPPPSPAFSYIDYTIFLLLGISMLWAWNMFLAAGPYFQTRFAPSPWLLNNFQAAEVSVSTITNLGSMLLLTRMQAGASYPKRIIASLFINMVTFTLLAVSTGFGVDAKGYFAFLMCMILATSLATGLCQNGIFAYVSGFGQPRYTQGIMTGQAVAGVLPCVAQIVSVLSVGEGGEGQEDGDGEPVVRSSAARAYFLTATVIAVVTLGAFMLLQARHRTPEKTQDNTTSDAASDQEDKKTVPLLLLFRKLFWLASGVFVTFAVTMFFPVFTQRILSVRPADQQGALTQPATFIPLAFLLWNTGDLLGRLLTAVPTLSLVHRPKIVFILAILRVAWVGLYHLCNIRGEGAVVESDFFYLVVVQLLFGLSNGYLGSICMIGAGEWVEPEEREAAGGFMGLMLVAGLAVGSLLSFAVAG
ncbi:uncharacterized protein LTR77_001668 [Saxophila tyrrhenica]|uniref:Nucleoside transporter 1 n=1 Tax=Saxophila tyrrhenica TaxID=1690608 RepID=A0AAV9PMS3_9PEZI|nr:hypothetical protein LTR77_001668 [Saxophila tyrrhenica]